MLARRLESALEHEVLGQSRAVRTITRTLTIALSGLAPPESPLGTYLFLGPSGSGKTHMARSLARLLHGDTSCLAVADCKRVMSDESLLALSQQIAPHFRVPLQQNGVRGMAQHSVLLIEHLEAAKAPVVQSLLGVLESGIMVLPDGKYGSLAGCLVLITSNLCAREIHGEDPPEIGFSHSAMDLEESEKARIYQTCAAAATKQWGSDLLGQVDDLIVFHRLRERHFPLILQRLLDALNRQLVPQRISIELASSASRYLIERCRRFPQHGAWFLDKVFRRFIIFPVADMVAGHGLHPGSRLNVDVDGQDRLRFEVATSTPADERRLRPLVVPIEWPAENGKSARPRP